MSQKEFNKGAKDIYYPDASRSITVTHQDQV